MKQETKVFIYKNIITIMIKVKQETLVKSKGRYAKKHYKREIIAFILYCLISNKTNSNQK